MQVRGNKMSINIGNNNNIKNSNFNSNSTPREGFWKRVLVNLTSNFIWWILGLLGIGGLVIAFWDKIMNIFK
jgi:hypothetical protein